MRENHGIATGRAHLALLSAGMQHAQATTFNTGEKYADELDLLGVSMCALYQASTCHRKCWGSGHVLESLSGRVYNLAGASFNLITCGYYDEALSLVRSIGEISNLVLLSIFDKAALSEWLQSDKKTRLRKYSPARVRDLLEKQGQKSALVANADWYSDLCEAYVHATQNTRPNMHNDLRPIVGGVFQEKGIEKALSELSTVVTFVAMLVCKYFQYDDLYQDIHDRLGRGAPASA